MVEVLYKFPELTKILDKLAGQKREVGITKYVTRVANTPSILMAAYNISIGIGNVVEVRCGRKLV